MARKYVALTQEEQDDIVLEFHWATERDHFCHALNAQRYTEMLPTLEDGAFKDRIQQLLNETQSRLAEVDAILDKTTAQLPQGQALTDAVARTAVKRHV